MALHAAVLPPQETVLLPVYKPEGQAATLLGSAVVDEAVNAAADHQHAAYLHALGEAESAAAVAKRAEQKGQETVRMLDGIRDRLQEEPAHPELLRGYVADFIGAEFEAAQAAGETQHIDILSWLGAGPVSGGATDEQLFTFLGRHVEHIDRQRQNPETLEVIEKTRQKYIQDMERLAKEKEVSPHALASLSRIRGAEVVIGDMWDTHMQRNMAYHIHGKTYVVIGQGYEVKDEKRDLLEAIRTDLPHEFLHLQFEDGLLPTWFKETMAEHLTLTLAHGQIMSMSPAERTDKGEYEPFRDFAAKVLAHTGRGNKHRLLREAIHAYTSPAGSHEWQRFIASFDEEWGSQGFEAIADFIETSARARMRDDSEFAHDVVGAMMAVAEQALPILPEMRRVAASGRRPEAYRGRHAASIAKPRHHIGAAALRSHRK